MTRHASARSTREPDLAALRQALQERLVHHLPAADCRDPVSTAMREGVLAPGKRIRPLLLLLLAHDFGTPPSPTGLLDMACAVEMVHAASLMLDDLPCMDDAALRRGQPTTHRRFGESVAILAAVALLSSAYATLAAAPGLRDDQRTAAVGLLARAVGQQGLVHGQFLDLTEGQAPRGAEAITCTNDLKTGTLFEATLLLAAIATDADDAVRRPLRQAAQALGQGFQLLDDLADGAPDTGKDPDQDRGKSTLVALLGEEEVRHRLRGLLQTVDTGLARACGADGATYAFLHTWFTRQLDGLACSGDTAPAAVSFTAP
ncbi:polyprenyl synthetase family protein [Salinicola avicenniae]|uniref:polyprenyl synthetase family protein n=1 Tax=Salinicola avicenniae TaxID=2916836 RepID=UPI00207497B6|nr:MULTISPECIES: polyprenyl synthetase family protein [unclassified Salinicola]